MAKVNTSKILSKADLSAIEREIDEINANADVLDPMDPAHSEQLYFYDAQLAEHIQTLTSSYRNARRREIGLTIVPSQPDAAAPF